MEEELLRFLNHEDVKIKTWSGGLEISIIDNGRLDISVGGGFWENTSSAELTKEQARELAKYLLCYADN